MKDKIFLIWSGANNIALKTNVFLKKSIIIFVTSWAITRTTPKWFLKVLAIIVNYFQKGLACVKKKIIKECTLFVKFARIQISLNAVDIIL